MVSSTSNMNNTPKRNEMFLIKRINNSSRHTIPTSIYTAVAAIIVLLFQIMSNLSLKILMMSQMQLLVMNWAKLLLILLLQKDNSETILSNILL